MKILHNGEEVELEEGTVLNDFLRKTGYRRVMVKINGEQVTAAKFKETILKDGDEVMAKRISGGG